MPCGPEGPQAGRAKQVCCDTVLLPTIVAMLSTARVAQMLS
ncbi:hypothetical protein ACFYE1_07550 [Kocuria sp. CPCC 205315]